MDTAVKILHSVQHLKISKHFVVPVFTFLFHINQTQSCKKVSLHVCMDWCKYENKPQPMVIGIKKILLTGASKEVGKLTACNGITYKGMNE